MTSSLMTQRRFAPFFWTQALGAFNDNIFRTALLLLVTFVAVPRHGWDLGLALNLAAGLFILPFLLLSAWGGELADRLDKQRLARRLKLLELGVMLGAALALWADSVVALYALLLLTGVQSALFGPLKYAILAQHLSPTELVRGNAWVTLGTFVAILTGTLVAGGLAALPEPWSRATLALALIGVALAGVVTSRAVPEAPSPSPGPADWRPLHTTGEILREGRRSPVAWRAMLGISAFWFLGSCYLTLLPAWAREVVGGDAAAVSLLLAALALGVGAGALLCARFSAGRLELGLVPLGALMIGTASLYLAGLPVLAGVERPVAALLGIGDFWWMLAGFALVGLGGGLYIVPLYTLIQLVSHEERRARMFAANNILNALLMVIAALYGVVVLTLLGVGQRGLVASLGVIALVIGLGLAVHRPRPVLRLLVFALVQLIYRLRFCGRQHVPARGAALVVCNHVSFMDALVIGGASPRPLRFLLDRPIYESPWLNWLFRLVGAIPVDSERSDPGGLRRSLAEVSHALRQGEVVMLFPEGRLTPDGEIQAFRRGLDLILARDPVPVVPAGLAGLWGSWTSNSDGPALTRLPRRFRARVALTFGEPMDAREARRGRVEARVRELKAEADSWVAGPASATLREP